MRGLPWHVSWVVTAWLGVVWYGWQVVMEGNKAVGVEYVDKGGRKHVVRTTDKGEVRRLHCTGGSHIHIHTHACVYAPYCLHSLASRTAGMPFRTTLRNTLGSSGVP
jgi:hypothetical protein